MSYNTTKKNALVPKEPENDEKLKKISELNFSNNLMANQKINDPLKSYNAISNKIKQKSRNNISGNFNSNFANSLQVSVKNTKQSPSSTLSIYFI